ncbi:MAG TPA: hypothetical protein VMS65_11370 [Polyangiaceae bacterium]|nr:hypothetical protein [Polyangiaceae bacterium]
MRRERGHVNPLGDVLSADHNLHLTALVEGARRGFRRDVAALEAALDDADLFIPLARRIADVPEGEPIALDRELEIMPHFLTDAEGGHHVALFTASDLVSLSAERLGWTTEGEDLGVCALPARIACQLALDLVDEATIIGLVIDAGHSSELMLRRAELASIVRGQPLPLVGYVADIPPEDGERTLVAEPSDPPPREFSELLAGCIAELPAVTKYRLVRTFNPERDLEPHLTLELTVTDEADRRALAERVMATIADHLPPPGYLDVVFDDG